jgi:hypothetical protein
MALGTTIPHAATTVGGGRRRRHGVVMLQAAAMVRVPCPKDPQKTSATGAARPEHYDRLRTG